MARTLTEHLDSGAGRRTWSGGAGSRAAGGALAAALSALLVVTLTVSRSGEAFDDPGTGGAGSVASGTVAVSDNDEGRSLFDLADLGPRQPLVRCLEIVYEGTILPVDLDLVAEAGGDLAPFLDLTLTEGRDGVFETCDGFQPGSEVFAGTLAGLVAAGPVALDPVLNTGETRSYRIELVLRDDAGALGRSTTVEFLWVVTPS